MAEAVIWMATEKLERLLVEKARFFVGAEYEVRQLIADLKRMARTLRNLEARGLHQYVMSVAEIAHDADVSIDSFISGVANSTRISRLYTSISDVGNSKWTSRLNSINEEIQSIRNRIEAVQTDIMNYYQSLAEKEEIPTVTLPHVQEEDMVGLEEEVKLLLKEAIFERTKEVSTLFIMGMGGIGKTTLASLLYNHDDVVAQFEIRAWVHVSNDSDSDSVLIELVKMLGVEIEAADVVSNIANNLRAMVFQHLKGRTYFIVLDNVWRQSHLDIILDAFPRNDCKSRIVITSRSRSIVRSNHPGFIHEMNFLDESKSWELFLKKVFTGDRRCPKHLEKIGRQIVRKCNGLALAIHEAGRKLSEKEESESVWEEFLESMDLSETSASLEISFNRLSARLKSCFSRLGFFKEGTTIRADKLLHICVAGGMIRRQFNEEIGRQELEKLIEEYLVQVKDRRRDHQLKNCDINYNLHRLAITKAKQELMFEVMTEEGQNHQSSHRPRHRAICCSRDKFNYSTNQDKHLLSLFFRGGGNFDGGPLYWISFKLLKILDFEGFGLKTLPEMVGTIVTLKYLGLRNNSLQELPCSLGHLVKLEVLDITQNFMVEVPNVIWKLDSLHHLYMSDIICAEPLKIDKLHKLQTLTYISVDNWMYEVSGTKMMTSLRKLGIEEVDMNSNVSKLFASLAELEKLEHLILRGFHFRNMPELHGLQALRGLRQLNLDGLLTRLPNNFPPNIEYLSMSNSCLDKDPMPILESLSKLLYLKLRNAFIGERMVISQQGFPQLKIISIEESWHLRSVKVGEGAMRKLRKFEFRRCPYMNILPEEIGLVNNRNKFKIVTTKDITIMSWEPTISSVKLRVRFGISFGSGGGHVLSQESERLTRYDIPRVGVSVGTFRDLSSDDTNILNLPPFFWL